MKLSIGEEPSQCSPSLVFELQFDHVRTPGVEPLGIPGDLRHSGKKPSSTFKC
jgi:hypothetical protein